MDLIEQEFRANLDPTTGAVGAVDMCEHMETLRALASECGHVVEGGVRYVVSTWAFLLGCGCKGGKVVSYCWTMLAQIERALRICAEEGLDWEFHEGDWLRQEIPETDLLFIDTNHFAWQLRKELDLHGPKARKYIVMHDTTRFGDASQDGTVPGLWAPIEELLAKGAWRLKARYTNCNGITVLERT